MPPVSDDFVYALALDGTGRHSDEYVRRVIHFYGKIPESQPELQHMIAAYEILMEGTQTARIERAMLLIGAVAVLILVLVMIS